MPCANMFSLAVRNWTTPAKATRGNVKRRKKALFQTRPRTQKHRAAQDGWSSHCMWSDCNKITEILSHLPCYRTWWNTTTLPFGLSASFCSINFTYLSSSCFYLWISLSLSRFIFALHIQNAVQSNAAEWCLWLIPMQAWCNAARQQ